MRLKTRLYLVVPISSPTFYLPAVLYITYLRFWPMDNTVGQDLVRRTHDLQNVRANILVLPKITNLPLMEGGLKGSFRLFLKCQGYPRGRVVGQAARKVELVMVISLPSPV